MKGIEYSIHIFLNPLYLFFAVYAVDYSFSKSTILVAGKCFVLKSSLTILKVNHDSLSHMCMHVGVWCVMCVVYTLWIVCCVSW